ncbi:Golgi-associated plant pathogenesis-related protein 1 isoform X2 [Grus americana]|uniref:Golgi-associated plant pathogenesis-related protein 1 isoform X2 n=1 Tax=Grus americana TaxID=9117 RepID=UPI002407AF06|nr:Golgi-associated plant pathogenesis-related protein 1 isoform X2 [Grus americana]
MGKSASKQFAEEVLKAHNDYRKKHGVPPLKLCKKLNRGAQQYAEELATTRVLKHSSESANGKCGENLAWASYDQPEFSRKTGLQGLLFGARTAGKKEPIVIPETSALGSKRDFATFLCGKCKLTLLREHRS